MEIDSGLAHLPDLAQAVGAVPCRAKLVAELNSFWLSNRCS